MIVTSCMPSARRRVSSASASAASPAPASTRHSTSRESVIKHLDLVVLGRIEAPRLFEEGTRLVEAAHSRPVAAEEAGRLGDLERISGSPSHVEDLAEQGIGLLHPPLVGAHVGDVLLCDRRIRIVADPDEHLSSALEKLERFVPAAVEVGANAQCVENKRETIEISEPLVDLRRACRVDCVVLAAKRHVPEIEYALGLGQGVLGAGALCLRDRALAPLDDGVVAPLAVKHRCVPPEELRSLSGGGTSLDVLERSNCLVQSVEGLVVTAEPQRRDRLFLHQACLLDDIARESVSRRNVRICRPLVLRHAHPRISECLPDPRHLLRWHLGDVLDDLQGPLEELPCLDICVLLLGAAGCRDRISPRLGPALTAVEVQ